MGLDPGIFTNDDPFLNFCIRTDKTIIPNAATIQVYRFNNFYIPAELHI